MTGRLYGYAMPLSAVDWWTLAGSGAHCNLKPSSGPISPSLQHSDSVEDWIVGHLTELSEAEKVKARYRSEPQINGSIEQGAMHFIYVVASKLWSEFGVLLHNPFQQNW